MTITTSISRTHASGSRISSQHNFDFNFARIPLAFFTNLNYFELSSKTKLLYAILLNLFEHNMEEDNKFRFSDESGFVFIYVANKELARLLNVSDSTIQRSLKDLESANLIEFGSRVRNTRPIYLLHAEPAVSNSIFYRSGAYFKNEELTFNTIEFTNEVGERIRFNTVEPEIIFVKIPMFLFTSDLYRSLSANSKLIFSLILNLHELSRKSKNIQKFSDSSGDSFVMLSNLQLSAILSISRNTARNGINELKKIKLIEQEEINKGVAPIYLLHAVRSEEESLFSFMNFSNDFFVHFPERNFDFAFKFSKENNHQAVVTEDFSVNNLIEEEEYLKTRRSNWSNIQFSIKKRNRALYAKVFFAPSGKKYTITNWRKSVKKQMLFNEVIKGDRGVITNICERSKMTDINKTRTGSQNLAPNMVNFDLPSDSESQFSPVIFGHPQNWTGGQSNLTTNKHLLAPLDKLTDKVIDQQADFFSNGLSTKISPKPIDDNDPIFVEQYLHDCNQRFDENIVSMLKYAHENDYCGAYELSSLIVRAFKDVSKGLWQRADKFKPGKNMLYDFNSFLNVEDENGNFGLKSSKIGYEVANTIKRVLKEKFGKYKSERKEVNDFESYFYVSLNNTFVDLYMSTQE